MYVKLGQTWRIKPEYIDIHQRQASGFIAVLTDDYVWLQAHGDISTRTKWALWELVKYYNFVCDATAVTITALYIDGYPMVLSRHFWEKGDPRQLEPANDLLNFPHLFSIGTPCTLE